MLGYCTLKKAKIALLIAEIKTPIRGCTQITAEIKTQIRGCTQISAEIKTQRGCTQISTDLS